MQTLLGFLFFGLLIYIVVAFLQRQRARRVGLAFDSTRLKYASIAAFATLAVGTATDDQTTTRAPAADTAAEASPEPSSEPTAQAETAAALAEARAERRAAAEARKEANRQKARAERAVRERKAANRAKARAERLARDKAAAAVAPQPLAAVGDSDAGSDSSGGGDYAGMTCPEIGHSFNVEPGSDPEHDRDNDGLACESQ